MNIKCMKSWCYTNNTVPLVSVIIIDFKLYTLQIMA